MTTKIPASMTTGLATEAQGAKADTALQSSTGVSKVTALAALKAIPDSKLTAGDVVAISYHTTTSDRGGGEFTVVRTASNTHPIDNEGMVVSSASAGFVFVRTEFLHDRRVSPCFFGAFGNGLDETTTLNKWLATFEANATAALSADAIPDVLPYLYVPAGKFYWAAGRVFTPVNGWFCMRGEGKHSVLKHFTLQLYSPNYLQAMQHPEVVDVMFDCNTFMEDAIVIGKRDDFGGSAPGENRWGGVRHGTFDRIHIRRPLGCGLFIIRDNNSRFGRIYVSRANKYGLLYIGGVDTMFEDCDFDRCFINGVRIQPYAGDATTGPFSGYGPGGLSFVHCTARYAGKENFFGTGGNDDTVIYPADTESGVTELDFFGQSSIRIGNWWESYFTHCSWANRSTTSGTPVPITRDVALASVTRATGNPLECRLTFSAPHAMSDTAVYTFEGFAINGGAYLNAPPRTSNGYRITVISTTVIEVNILYVANWTGSTTVSFPNWDFRIMGQEKGYTPRVINDIFFTGMNSNFNYFARITGLHLGTMRLKQTVVLGPKIIYLHSDHIKGIFPSVEDEDSSVPYIGVGGYSGGWSRTGPRAFGVISGTEVDEDNSGWQAVRPDPAGGANGDGSARNVFALNLRYDRAEFGRWREDTDALTGVAVGTSRRTSFMRDGVEEAYIDATTGQWTFEKRVYFTEALANPALILPNVYMATSGNLQLYEGDPIVEEDEDVNGKWIKFASGMMFCTSPVFTVDVATANGSGFKTATETTWTFPEAFVTKFPVVSPGNSGNSGTHWAVARPNSLTQGSLSAFAFVSTTARGIQAIAVGKWK